MLYWTISAPRSAWNRIARPGRAPTRSLRMPLLLSRKDVESVLTMQDCLAAVEKAFAELARGNAVMPQRSVIRVAAHKGVFLGMPALIGGDTNALGLKAVTVYPDNPAKHDLPTTLGTLMLCDPA